MSWIHMVSKQQGQPVNCAGDPGQCHPAKGLPAALTPTLQFLVDASSLCQRRAACLAISLCSVMSGLRTNENRLVGTEELEDRKAHPKFKTLMSSD